MRPLFALALATSFLALPATAPAAPEPALDADALWAWSWDSPESLADTAAADGFSRVYLYSQGGFDRRVRATIAALTARGIEVEALGGESRWATTQRADLRDFVRSAVAYQRTAPTRNRLAGIHLDVEPYGLPAWDRDRDATARSLLRSLAIAERLAGDLPLAADIPFWFDEIRPGRGRGSLAEAVIRRTDATTVMAYRDSGPAAADVAERELAIAAGLGKTVTVGVETDDVRPEQVTFAEEGRAALAFAIHLIGERFDSDASFGGIAVHHYESLRTLRP